MGWDEQAVADMWEHGRGVVIEVAEDVARTLWGLFWRWGKPRLTLWDSHRKRSSFHIVCGLVLPQEGMAAVGGAVEKYREERAAWTRERYKRAANAVKALLGPECGGWPYTVYQEAGGLEGVEHSVAVVNQLLVEAGG